MNKIIFILFVSIFNASPLFAQEKKTSGILDISEEALARPLIFLLKQKNDSITAIKVKKKRNYFYGIKTRKRYVITQRGNKEFIEKFYVLKTKGKKISPYMMHIFSYDRKDREIVEKNHHISDNYLLHGPYKKMLNGKLIQEGIFHKGLKHGRWVTYDEKGHLIRKDKYFQGWPKESLASFYDSNQKKLKALIPIKHGRRDGEYYRFYENGRIAVQGTYNSGQKVGMWKLFFPRTGKRKREIIYQKKAFSREFFSVINREWDYKGKLIYNYIINRKNNPSIFAEK